VPRTPSTRNRAKPGSRGGGRFFHIELRPSGQFVEFRVQDVGLPGGVERVAGQRASGSWDTAKWLVEKSHAHMENDHLVPDSSEAKKLFASLGSARLPTSKKHRPRCGSAGKPLQDDPQASSRQVLSPPARPSRRLPVGRSLSAVRMIASHCRSRRARRPSPYRFWSEPGARLSGRREADRHAEWFGFDSSLAGRQSLKTPLSGAFRHGQF